MEATVTIAPVTRERGFAGFKSGRDWFGKVIDAVPESVRSLTAPAIIIQAHARAYIARQKYKRTRKAIIRIQCSWKRVQAQREIERRRSAAETIRSFTKGFMARREPENEVNRKFLQFIRSEFIAHLAKNLPQSVLDKSWPEAPTSCREASELLRRLHQRILVRNYFRQLSTKQKMQLRWKTEASDLFKEWKLSYAATVGEPFRTSHLSTVQELSLRTAFDKIRQQHRAGHVIYCLTVAKFDRHGFKQRQWFLVLTANALYFLDAKTYILKHAVPFKSLEDSCMKVSSLSDGLLVMSLPPDSAAKQQKKAGDLILNLGWNLIEFVSQLTLLTGNRKLLYAAHDNRLRHHAADGKVATIEFQRNASPIISSNSGGKPQLLMI